MKTARSFLFSMSCALAAGLLWASAATAAEGAAGVVVAFKGQASATDATGASRELRKQDAVRVGDTIRTGPGSYVLIEFVDGAKTTVRPNSELSIDEYAYQTGNDGALVKLIKGGLRTITGGIAQSRPGSYRVDTGVATLGVRGTEFSVYICGENCD